MINSQENLIKSIKSDSYIELCGLVLVDFRVMMCPSILQSSSGAFLLVCSSVCARLLDMVFCC
jgi:hypothetical protein